MLDKLIQEILKLSAQEGKGSRVSLEMLESVWPWLVGQDMARRTRPLSWEDGTLHIDVSTYAWVQELSFHQKDLTARIQRLFPWPLRSLKLSVSGQFTPLQQSDELPLIQGAHARIQRPAWDPTLLDEEEVQEDLGRLDEETRELLLKIRRNASDSKG